MADPAEHWMIQAAVAAAPPLSTDTIDRLRLILATAPKTTTAPARSPAEAPQRRAA